MFREYIRYINDNPNRYWFKRKLYGWGWVPATKEGVLILLAFIAFLIWSGFVMESHSPVTDQDAMWFLGKIALATLLLIGICYKTGERPKWQWGFPKKEENNQQ